MNTTEKILNAMNIKSEVQTENVFIPADKLMDSANELFEKIEQLKKDIEHQEKTLKHWNNNNPLLLDSSEYEQDLKDKKLKLKMMEVSYKNICIQMSKTETI